MACQIDGNQYFAPNGAKSELYEDLKVRVGEAQAKDLFVLAYTPNFIRDVQQELIYNYKNKFPQTPSTLDFKETQTKNTRTFQVLENGAKGKITVEPFQDGYKVKTVNVSRENRGKGYAKAMYSYVARKMIAEGQNLYGDTSRTETNSIWESLGASNKIIYAKPLNAFNTNGEIYAENVLEYATQLNENTEPLSFEEQNEVRMMMAEFPEIEDSDELADSLTKAFYNEGVFAPTKNSLRQLYSKYESDLILSDVNILGIVKESIEKLKRTGKIYNTTVLPATYKTNELNLFGKLKVENPYIIDQDIIEQYGGVENADLSEIKNRSITQEYLDQFKRIPAVYENGVPIIEQVIYTNAIKTVDDPKVFEAVDALISAPELVDTSKLEQKLSNWMLNYGINIEGFTKDLLPSLKNFIENPSAENTQIFSDKYREVFNIPVKQREYVTKIENKERDLVYIQTSKSEQQLFDEMDLLQTETANTYHKIERVDFEDMKRAFNLSDDITELQAYKDYFNYNTKSVSEIQEFYPLELTHSLGYLTDEFISDMNVEILKNPQSELYNKFKITEKGIEMIYQDPISISQITSYLLEPTNLNIALQEYSIISKQMPNLVDTNVQILNNKYNNRLLAVNNFEKVKVADSDFIKLNTETVIAKNETSEFINVENELFELVNKQKNQNIYKKIEKNLNTDYNQVKVEMPNLEPIILQQPIQTTDYKDINKIYKSTEITSRFDC